MKYHFYDKEIRSVLSSDIDARVRYFKHKVAGWENLWLMEDENGFFTDCNSNGDEVLILWPFKEYAKISLKNNQKFYNQLKEVNIHYFLDHYLEYIKEHKIKLFVFPGINNDGALFDADDFKIMMEEELAKYGDYDDEYEDNSLEKRLGKNKDN